MKTKIKFIVLLIVVASTAFSQEVKFYNDSLGKIVKQAKTQNKYLFVDCYTSWCRWCKFMEMKTFPDKAVADFMNTNFIAFKQDMENKEGIKLAMKYRVSSYPTYLVFNPNGSLVYKFIGSSESAAFIEILKKAIDTKNQLTYSNNIEEILNYPSFYKNSFTIKSYKVSPDSVAAFMEKQQDLFSEVSWCVMSRFAQDENINKYFMDNFQKYTQLFGKTETEAKITNIAQYNINIAIEQKDTSKLNKVISIVSKYISSEEIREDLICKMKFSYYQNVKAWSDMIAAINNYIKKAGYSNSFVINQYCWSIYEKVEDKEAVKQAAQWMQNVINKDPIYEYVDTYAALLYKSGDYKKAEEYATKAINIAESNKINADETKAMLKKIRNDAGNK